MPGFHRTDVIGHLGRDPEVRTVGDTSVCNFSVAVTEKWVGKDGQKQEHTEWYSVDVWGAMGQACAKYLAKGRAVFVSGTQRTREYETDDGQKRKATTLRAQRVQFLGGGPSEKKQDNPQQQDIEPPF